MLKAHRTAMWRLFYTTDKMPDLFVVPRGLSVLKSFTKSWHVRSSIFTSCRRWTYLVGARTEQPVFFFQNISYIYTGL